MNEKKNRTLQRRVRQVLNIKGARADTHTHTRIGIQQLFKDMQINAGKHGATSACACALALRHIKHHHVHYLLLILAGSQRQHAPLCVCKFVPLLVFLTACM